MLLRKKIEKERDDKIVLRDVLGIYNEYLYEENLYNEIYDYFVQKTIVETNKIKTELIVKESTQIFISAKMSVMAMIVTFFTLIINLYVKSIDLIKNNDLLISFVLTGMILAVGFLMIYLSKNIFQFLYTNKKDLRMNRYILCVIDDIEKGDRLA